MFRRHTRIRGSVRVAGLIAALALLAGCASRRAAVIEAPRVTARDTARVTIVTDSVRITDSVRVTSERTGDTVRLTTERWRTVWRDRVRRDTVRLAARDTVTVVRTVTEKARATSAGRLLWPAAAAIAALALLAGVLKK